MWCSAVGCLVTLILSLLVVPLVTHAQPPSHLPRVGVLGERAPTDPFLAAFRQGLRELGYTEGQNIVIEARYTHGVLDRVPVLAAELLRLKVDVLVVGGTVAAQSAKALTTTVPIVFTRCGDPVGSGLVASLARPGGNATGLSVRVSGLSGKQLEILKTAVPQVSRVAVLYNPVNPSAKPALDEMREVARARALAVELHVLEVRQPHELASAFAALTAWRAEALLAISDAVFGNTLAELAQLAAENRLPATYERREFVEAGGLLTYGPSFADNYRRAATYVDKILKGAKPADLPVEQPMKFELVINLKTPKALGLTIPPMLLFQADEVIQ
jgi:putative tryptophan/tyrosine transport system substrate-binding protein